MQLSTSFRVAEEAGCKPHVPRLLGGSGPVSAGLLQPDLVLVTPAFQLLQPTSSATFERSSKSVAAWMRATIILHVIPRRASLAGANVRRVLSAFLHLPLSSSHTTSHPQILASTHTDNMSTEEQQFDDDSQMGGPGAPTPVAALEVRIFST